MLILNDLHLSATRAAGATPASAAALKAFSMSSLSAFMQTSNEDVLIAGDVFDTWQTPFSDVLKTYEIFTEFLSRGHRLVVMAANHDLSTDSSKLGSLQFLMALLADKQNLQFIIGKGCWVGEGLYCVPHMENQDAYDLELSRVPECEVLFLHANLDNNFATVSDHSLNTTRKQLEALPAKLVYFGHEHHQRKLGKAFVGGVQWPTSVADCLDQKDKFAYRLTGTSLEPIRTWDKANYAELDWRNPTPSTAQFVRFTGTATPEEGAAVADTIARYRKASTAFVVGNAVKIGSEDRAEFEVQSLDQARSFDVMGALKKFLTEDEYSILEKLE
jgi:hypothetical protein